MTLEISEHTMLDDLVRELPAARGILRKFGILYGGGISDHSARKAFPTETASAFHPKRAATPA